MFFLGRSAFTASVCSGAAAPFNTRVDALLLRMANRICSAAFRSPLKAPRSEQKQQAIESDEQRVALTSLTNVRSHSEQQHHSPQLHMESTLADPKATSLPGSPSPRKSGRRRSSISSTEQHDSPARALLRAETALAEATAAALPESPSQPGRSGRRRSSVSSAGGRRSSTSSAGSGWGRAAALLAQLDDERDRRIAAEADAREARAELEETPIQWIRADLGCGSQVAAGSQLR